MDKRGYRPGRIEELLALGEIMTELQREYPIVALDSAWRGSDGDLGVPCLWSDDRLRLLYLDWFEDGWSPYYRFLVLRK